MNRLLWCGRILRKDTKSISMAVVRLRGYHTTMAWVAAAVLLVIAGVAESARPPRSSQNKVIGSAFDIVAQYESQYDALYANGKADNFTKITEMYCGHGFIAAEDPPGSQPNFLNRTALPSFFEQIYANGVGPTEILTKPNYVYYNEAQNVIHEVGVRQTNRPNRDPTTSYYVRWVYCEKMKEWKLENHVAILDEPLGPMPGGEAATTNNNVGALANVTELDEQFSKTYAQKDFGALTFFYSATPVFLPNTDWGFVTNAVDVGHYFALKMYEEKNITTFERRPLHALVDSGNPTGVLHELGITTMGTAGGQSTSCYHYTRWVKQAAGWRIDVDVLSVGLLGPPASG